MLQGKRVKSQLIDISLHGTLFKFFKHPTLDSLISVGNDHDLSVWDLNTLELLYKVEGNEYAIADALIYEDYYVIASVNGELIVYEGKEIWKKIKLPSIPVSCCVHEGLLYIGTTSDQVLCYDLSNLNLQNTITSTSWATQLGSYDGKLYIMNQKINFGDQCIDLGHKGQIMSHHKVGNLFISGDSSGKAILSTFPDFNKLYEHQMESAIVQVSIVDESILIGTLDPGIDIITQGKVHRIPDRAAPFLLCSKNKIINRSNILTRQAFCDLYE